MKIGEALAERAALSRQVNTLRSRITANISFHEDENPAENAGALLEESNAVAERLGTLIFQINRTNAQTEFPVLGTITAALAYRDVLNTKIATFEGAVKAANGIANRGYYGGRSAKTELKTVYAIDVTAMQIRIQDLEQERRVLDAQLQTLSWSTDLIES